MSYKIELAPAFIRHFKKLIKRYPSLTNDIIELRAELQSNPHLGTPIGKNCYKIRIAIK